VHAEVILRAQKLEELTVVTKQMKLLLTTSQIFQSHSLEETERWKILLIPFTLPNILIPKFSDFLQLVCQH